MKQRSGTSSEKATVLTRSKICVIVLISTVLVETVFIACSGLGVDTSPRSAASNSTSNSSETSRPVVVTASLISDAARFLLLYDAHCREEMLLRDVQRPKVKDMTGTDTRKSEVQLRLSICPCAPQSLGGAMTARRCFKSLILPSGQRP
ncbi:hypothetical protein LSAT2_022331 [Lamellibrachia satsuma]|nr:hypothetical protein LSAT2_022331 [Lamellibrachia satsuma]